MKSRQRSILNRARMPANIEGRKYMTMFPHLFSERGLSLDRLRALVEVASAGSIAQAVHGDPTLQSQYSRQIKELGEFFGAELTRKKGRSLVLTAEGEELVRIARESMRALENFKCRTRNSMYRFTLGAGDSQHVWMVVPVLSDMVRQGLPWQFSFKNLRNSEISKGLLDMELDFGIIRSSSLSSDQLESHTIMTVSYSLYVPRGMVPAGREKDFKWLMENRPMTTLTSDTTFHEMLVACLRNLGIDSEALCGTQSFPFAARLLRSGTYMAILPHTAERDFDDSILKVECPDLAPLNREFSLAWNPRLIKVRPVAERVIAFFLKQLKGV